MRAKQTVFIFFGVSVSLILSFFSMLYAYDPLQLFHKHWHGDKRVLSRDMRAQAAGILNTYDYDSIILGTSMLANTSAKEASAVFGAKFLNVSFPGSDFYERSFVLKYALKNKKVKKVLYSLDDIGLVEGRERDASDFSYLYDTNRFNDFKIYITKKQLTCLFLFSSSPQCQGEVRDIDRPTAWYYKQEHKQRFGGMKNWFKAKNSPQIKKAFANILDVTKKIKNREVAKKFPLEEKKLELKNYLDKNIISIAQQYKDTEFILMLPPYSRLNYAMNAQYDKQKFELYLSSLLYLVVKSSEVKNIKIFAWGNEKFVDQIKNYKDPSHYEYTFNSWMLKQIKLKQGLLNNDNVNSYINLFKDKSLHYDIFKISKSIETYLDQE